MREGVLCGFHSALGEVILASALGGETRSTTDLPWAQLCVGENAYLSGHRGRILFISLRKQVYWITMYSATQMRSHASIYGSMQGTQSRHRPFCFSYE